MTLLPGCAAKEAPPSPKPRDPEPPATTTAIDVTGIVQKAQLRVISGGNLTLEESELTVVARDRGQPLAEQVWVSVVGVAAPADAPPVAAGRAGERLGLRPGRWQLRVAWGPAPTARGQGTLNTIELEPGKRYELIADLDFPTGTVRPLITNRGTSIVHESLVRVGDVDVPATQPLVMSAGEHVVTVVWTPATGDPQVREAVPLTVKAGTTTELSVEFGERLARVRVVLHGKDDAPLLAPGARVTFKQSGRVASDGSTDRVHQMAPGAYDVHVRYVENPLLAVSVHRRNVTLPESAQPVDLPVEIDVRAGELIVTAERDNLDISNSCKLRLVRAGQEDAREREFALAPLRVPPATWNATVICGSAQREIPGLVIVVGQPLHRVIRL